MKMILTPFEYNEPVYVFYIVRKHYVAAYITELLIALGLCLLQIMHSSMFQKQP